MSVFLTKQDFHPDMSASEAATLWMRNHLCTDTGLAAIVDNDDGTTTVKYQKSPHGIVIMLHDGTCLPVPYKYRDGDPILLN
jgi:hypothetical protein